jgi:hypothetical protein
MSTEEKPAAPAAVSNMQTPTTRLHTFTDLLDEFNAGALRDALAVALNTTTLAAALFEGKGELSLKLISEPIKSTSQVKLRAQLSYTCPTAQGKKSETIKSEAVMFVQKGGGVSPIQTADQLELELPTGKKK